jgi:hypothetical protein
VGASGIRRRKPRRELPRVESLPPGDADRVFGRFSWGGFSPAGNLERNGFFWRQLRRRRVRDGWTILGYGWWVFAAVSIALVLLVTVGGLFR